MINNMPAPREPPHRGADKRTILQGHNLFGKLKGGINACAARFSTGCAANYNGHLFHGHFLGVIRKPHSRLHGQEGS